MLILDGHESHVSAEFEQYCKEHNIIPISMPPHSFHLLQPLEVGLFSPLKRVYGDEINLFIRASFNHITKSEFFIAFKAAHDKIFTEENMRSGFRGAGISPWDPDSVISKLDVRLQTPVQSLPMSPSKWESQTPSNAHHTVQQSSFIKGRISAHQGSSPTPILEAVEWLASIHQEFDLEAAHQDQGGYESHRAEYQRKRKRRSDCTSNTSRRQRKATCLPNIMPTTPPPSNTEAQGRLPLRSRTSTSASTSASTSSSEAGEGHDALSGGISGGIGSGSVSPKKKRRVDEAATAADIDRTPTAASVTSRSITRRPIIAPKSKTRGRNTSPIKTVSSLRQLQKPVHVVALGNNNRDLLPEDTYDLYRNQATNELGFCTGSY
jgi:hypothetical protein